MVNSLQLSGAVGQQSKMASGLAARAARPPRTTASMSIMGSKEADTKVPVMIGLVQCKSAIASRCRSPSSTGSSVGTTHVDCRSNAGSASVRRAKATQSSNVDGRISGLPQSKTRMAADPGQ